MKRLVLLIFPAFLLVVNLFSQFTYSSVSTGSRDRNGASFLEVPYASSLDIAHRLRAIDEHLASSITTIVNGTDNSVLTKIIALYFPRKTLAFPATDYLGLLAGSDPSDSKIVMALRDKRAAHLAKELYLARSKFFEHRYFVVPYKTNFGTSDEFTSETLQNASSASQKVLLTLGGDQTVLNRFTTGQAPEIKVVPWSAVRNHVVFVDSYFGHSWTYNTEPTSFFGQEPDYFYDGQTIGGVGRYLLLRIENPSPKVRLVMFITETLQSDGVASIPDVKAYGENAASFHFIGRGSGRAKSDPIVPKMIDGGAYIFIDMGANGKRFKRQTLGRLFNLYHTEIPLDPRLIVGFLRDLSAVDENQLAALHAPSIVTSTTDYRSPGLFFSGLYEDGWLSEHSSFELVSKAGEHVALTGVVPQIDSDTFSTNVQVRVDGEAVASETLLIGSFSISSTKQLKAGKHRVEILFSATQRLPGDDLRPVGSKLCLIGFVSKPVSSGGC